MLSTHPRTESREHFRRRALLLAFAVVLTWILYDFSGGESTKVPDRVPYHHVSVPSGTRNAPAAAVANEGRADQHCRTTVLRCSGGANATGDFQLVGAPLHSRQFQRDVNGIQLKKTRGIVVLEERSRALAACREVARNCTQIDQRHASYAVWLCLSPSGCEGCIFFSRKDHRSVFDLGALKQRMRDGSSGAYVAASHFGPDTFYLRIVGPEVVAKHPLFHTDGASWDFGTGVETPIHYSLPFQLLSSGTYYLEGEQLYEHFDAFHERTKTHINLMRSPLFPLVERRGKYGEIVGADLHHPKFNRYRLHNDTLGKYLRSSKYRSSKYYTWDEYTFASSVHFECSLRRAGQIVAPLWAGESGRWQQRGTANAPASREDAHTHFERTRPLVLYDYHPAQWSNAAVLSGFPTDESNTFAERISPRTPASSAYRIGFFGDSHLRVTYVHFRNYLAYPCAPPEDHGTKSMSGANARSLVRGRP